MTRHALPFAALTLLAATLIGCAHHPEITFADREHEERTFSKPFIKGTSFTFPKIDTNGLDYWLIFVDQSPCKLSTLSNPKAYKGTPTAPPTCLIDFEPHDGRDRLYRYTIYTAQESDKPQEPPPLQIPYYKPEYSCRPACNGTN